MAWNDRAWGFVLANLQKRFDSGPIDWTEWMAQLHTLHQQCAQPAAAAASR